MPLASATASCCWRKDASAASVRWRSCARRPASPPPGWRRCSLRSPDPAVVRRAPFHPLLAKELWEVASGRALWTMLLILCPLVGYSFFQAAALYGEASSAARDSPAMASGLSPFDGVLVPTFGALYVAVTLLFPFVAIRTLGREKETGALRLLVQLPYRVPSLIAAKMTAIFGAWLAAVIPAASALAIWLMLGGHLYVPETLDLLLGHLLYGLLVGSIALFSASISESSATAAIITLAFTIGSWVLDFALAGQPGVLGWVSRLSLTQTLRGFEQGLLSAGLVLGIVAAICGFAALAAVWLHPGVPLRAKLIRSAICLAVAAAVIAAATQIGLSLAYGEIEYSYGGRSDKSRSTSHREILPLIYALAQRPIPTPIAGEEYPGYPLLANASPALAWFLGGLPLLIVIARWWSRRPPQIAPQLIKHGGQP